MVPPCSRNNGSPGRAADTRMVQVHMDQPVVAGSPIRKGWRLIDSGTYGRVPAITFQE